jgi:hypothetical protein
MKLPRILDWLRRRLPPHSSQPSALGTGPTLGSSVSTALTDGETTWSERVDLVSLAQQVLQSNGHMAASDGTSVTHDESGYALKPTLVELQPLQDGRVRSVTIIHVYHPQLPPEGVFEYQHAAAATLEKSIVAGFEQWLRFDFPAFLDAVREIPKACHSWQLSIPPKDGLPEIRRRAILSPVAHFLERPQAAHDETHSFCPCCLLTRTYEAFRPLIEADGFYGIRLYAALSADGTAQADCRINGQDWEQGAAALRDYAASWTRTGGYEFRKQYVILQEDPNPRSLASQALRPPGGA